MESSKETGFEPEAPILCINNCGFFGSATTMNMCSKCHKDTVLKQEQAKLATSSTKNLVNGGLTINTMGPTFVNTINPQTEAVEMSFGSPHSAQGSSSSSGSETKPNQGPKRCTTCHKRVGLAGFNCRCGNVFCGSHRYSDKHDCPFDYRTSAQDAIAKANPVVKSKKIDRI
ncbi:hypothetical protein LguiB_033521 [Lonicera macranthoides]